VIFPGGADRLDDSSGALVQVRFSVSRGAPAPFGLAHELPESRVLLNRALALPSSICLLVTVGLLSASVMSNTQDTARRTSQGSSGSPGFPGEHPTWAREPRATVRVAIHFDTQLRDARSGIFSCEYLLILTR
jgi:hypothetical protein